MKKLFIFLSISLFCVGCCKKELSDEEKIRLAPYKFNAQEYYDKAIKHSIIEDSAGHTLIFHEVGLRGWRDYAFSIEHSPECKKCCEIYD